MLSSNKDLVKERILDFRKMRRVTQADMAAYLNIKRGSYQFRESTGDFKWEEIELIADYFDVSPYFLKYGIEEDELRDLARQLRAPSVFVNQTIPFLTVLKKSPKLTDFSKAL